ncbi:DUF4180 domain-containing protein [Niabella sp. W65]|nr:DUF4180 domain-containing protein [Niabella sp. W65]MCH7366617.1 DUF4180 domain-containing protein [Niabella sp. W65]ULT42331.1 DUF4180 domain-containing protein [Niabella sp. I65]
MQIETHHIKGIKVAEIITDEIILKTTEDGIDLLGNLYYQGFDKIILHKKILLPAFLILKPGSPEISFKSSRNIGCLW